MPQTINPTITAAGLAAAVNASIGGLFLSLTHITLGAGQYTPAVNGNGEATQADLVSRREKIAFGAGSGSAPRQVTFGATFPVYGGAAYEVGEIGIWAGDPDNGGILFSVYSRPGYVHALRNDQTGLVESYSFTLNRVPDNSVTVTVDPNSTALNQLVDDHERKPDPHPQYFLRSEIAALRTAVLQMTYPVGSVYITYNTDASPASLFGFGTWQLTAVGRMFVGHDVTDAAFDTVGEQGGAKTHTLEATEMPSHRHLVVANGMGNSTALTATNSLALYDDQGGNNQYALTGNAAEPTLGHTTATGGGQPHNNLPPFEVVRKWRRMADAGGAVGPTAFGFAPAYNAPPNSAVTSAPTTLSGMAAPSPISVTGGTYSLNGGAFTAAPGTVVNGDVVRVQLMTPAAFQANQTATVTVNAVTGSFTATTVASPTADTTPDAFAFIPASGAPQSTPTVSNAITVTGINAPSTISVVGGSYSINGAPFTSATGVVSNGDSVRAQLTTAASASTAQSATVTIGGIGSTFQVTTASQTNVTITPSPTSSALTANTDNAARTLSSVIDLTISGSTGPYTTTVALLTNNGGAGEIAAVVTSPTRVTFSSSKVRYGVDWNRGVWRITSTSAAGVASFVDVSISHRYESFQ